MKQITIKIKENEYIIKQSFRSYLLFEEMENKQIDEITSIKDLLTLLYCTLKGCNKTFTYSFDEFIDVIDENPELFTKFNEFNASITEPTQKKTKKKE